MGESTVASGLQRTTFTSNVNIYNGPYGTKVIGPGLNHGWISRGGVNWGGAWGTGVVSPPPAVMARPCWPVMPLRCWRIRAVRAADCVGLLGAAA